MEIVKSRSVKDWAISLLFIIIGVVMMILGSTEVLVLGAIVFVFGLLLLLICKSACRFTGNPAQYARSTKEYSASCKTALCDFLAGKADSFENPEDAGGILLYVYTTKDKRAGDDTEIPFGYARMYEFSQYEYVPVGDIYKLTAAQIAKLQ